MADFDYGLHVLFVGLLTAILATSMMLVQNDIKKTLGYSTIGQMGYMMMACGLGAFHFAVFHLIAHGLFKADIFLNTGKGIHNIRKYPSAPSEISDFKKVGFTNLFSTDGKFDMSLICSENLKPIGYA